MKKIRFFIALSAVMAFASCTVEKRKYTDGYHVEWKRNHGKGVQAETKELGVDQNQTAVLSNESQTVAPAIEVQTAQVQQGPLNSESAVAKAEPKADRVSKSGKKATIKPSKNEEIAYVNKRQLFKEFNRAKVEMYSAQPLDSGSEPDEVLLIVLAIFIPPLAMYLYEGSWTSRCTINLILTLLCGLPGMIHALVVILGNR